MKWHTPPPPSTTPPPVTGGPPPTLTVHYKRPAGDYAGWQIHTFGAAVDPGWNNGHNITATDAFGAIYDVPLNPGAGAGSITKNAAHADTTPGRLAASHPSARW